MNADRLVNVNRTDLPKCLGCPRNKTLRQDGSSPTFWSGITSVDYVCNGNPDCRATYEEVHVDPKDPNSPARTRRLSGQCMDFYIDTNDFLHSLCYHAVL